MGRFIAQISVYTVGTAGMAVLTLGVGGVVGCLLAAPPTARVILKCACDLILILERAFRYEGKYVTGRQIEDAAKEYVKVAAMVGFKRHQTRQAIVHEEVDKLIPLLRVDLGLRFGRIRTGMEDIIMKSRVGYGMTNLSIGDSSKGVAFPSELSDLNSPSELEAINSPGELSGVSSRSQVSELDS